MKSVLLFVAGVLTLVPVVGAKTLLWLPLDEEEPGTAIVDGSDGGVTNAVNPATVVRACTIKGEALMTGKDRPENAPRYVKPHTGIQVYDPVTGAKRRNRSAMRFTTSTTEGQMASYYGTTLRIPGTDTSLNPKGSFTIECFVATRMNGGVSIFAPLIGKRDDSLTAESWALYLVPQYGKIALRLRTGTSGAKISDYSANMPGPVVNDGNWHHLAYVYDKTQGKAFVYVDYACQFEVPTTSGKTDEDVHYYSGSEIEWKGAIYIGGYPLKNGENGYRKFNGNLDEIRISDEALSPDRFLRLQPEDDDELVHLRFDYIDLPGGNENVWSIYANYNDRLDIPAKLSRPIGSTYVVPGKSEKPAPIVRAGAYAEAVTNVSSFSVTTNNGAGAYVYVMNLSNYLSGQQKAANPVATNVDYTVECFFKARNPAKFEGKQHIFKFGTVPICGALLRNNADGTLMYTFNNNDWKGKYSAEKTANEGWHHMAFVNDAGRKEVRCYFDGKLSYCENNVTNRIAANQNLTVCATTDSSNRQYFDGWVDDLRVMKRALNPDEFLCTGDTRVRSDDPTIAFLNFENDYAVSPYPTLMTGNVVARAHGSTGKVPVFKGRVREWLVPSGPVTNTVGSETFVRCDDSVIELPASTLFEQHAFTVEFMANLDRFVANGNLIRYVRQEDATSAPVWALFSPNKSGQLQCRLQLNKNGAASAQYSDFWYLPNGWQGRWHHYALTVQEDVSNQKTLVELFIDGQTLGRKECSGLLDYSISSMKDGRVMWGASTAANQVYAGLDALRFSRGVLTPDQFITQVPIGGTVLIR